MNRVNPPKNTSRTKKTTRRSWSAAEKAVIVRRYLGDGVSQTDLADEYKVTPGQISQWSKKVLESIESIFKDSAKKAESVHQKKLQQREKKIHHLQEVVDELSREVLRLKKSSGAR